MSNIIVEDEECTGRTIIVPFEDEEEEDMKVEQVERIRYRFRDLGLNCDCIK